MADPEDIRNYINPHPRFSAASQLERLKDAGELYVEDSTGKVVDAVIRSIRPVLRSIVRVDELFLLAPTDGKPLHRKRALAKRIEAVTEAGGRVRERSSGLQSDQAAFHNAVMRAVEMIANGGRGQPGVAKSGRPGREFSPEQMNAMRRIWLSRHYETRDAATAAIQALGINITRPRLYQILGRPDQNPEALIDVEKVKKSKPKKHHCYVYFIRNGNTVKIGKSETPHKRMSNMATANHAKLEMLAIIDGDVKRERLLHKKFRADHIKGEWFNLSPAILRYIKSVKKSGKKS